MLNNLDINEGKQNTDKKNRISIFAGNKVEQLTGNREKVASPYSPYRRKSAHKTKQRCRKAF